MSQHYSNPEREQEPTSLPDLETFWVDGFSGCPICEMDEEPEFTYGSQDMIDDHKSNHVGWYYWFCLPGCLPDSEAFGPFATEEEALEDAREQVNNY